jgi:hypothetical protein
LKKIAGIFFIVLQFCNSIVIETFSLSKVWIWMDLEKGC